MFSLKILAMLSLFIFQTFQRNTKILDTTLQNAYDHTFIYIIVMCENNGQL